MDGIRGSFKTEAGNRPSIHVIRSGGPASKSYDPAGYISTNNIARGMVRDSQIRFQSTENTFSLTT
jgi:hypothetical protein